MVFLWFSYGIIDELTPLHIGQPPPKNWRHVQAASRSPSARLPAWHLRSADLSMGISGS